jgi:hypothetical protein
MDRAAHRENGDLAPRRRRKPDRCWKHRLVAPPFLPVAPVLVVCAIWSARLVLAIAGQLARGAGRKVYERLRHLLSPCHKECFSKSTVGVGGATASSCRVVRFLCVTHCCKLRRKCRRPPEVLHPACFVAPYWHCSALGQKGSKRIRILSDRGGDLPLNIEVNDKMMAKLPSWGRGKQPVGTMAYIDTIQRKHLISDATKSANARTRGSAAYRSA